MRIHVNDSVSARDIHAATAYASQSTGHGMVDAEITEHNSKSHDHAFNVKLTGDGSVNRRRVNPGKRTAGVYGEHLDYAATHDSWGFFFAYLYGIDPNMKCGWAYTDMHDFLDKTDSKYPIKVSLGGN